MNTLSRLGFAAAITLLVTATAVAQPLVANADPATGAAPAAATVPPASTRPELPTDYVIGADDVLSIVFWRDKDMSADVVVRPDGKITLPLLNEVSAAGLTPDQLRERIEEDARRFVSDATATVAVKQINSRKVFITGAVEHPGAYPLTVPTTVLQIIATAGGLKDYADDKHIVVMRKEGRVQASYFFDYHSVIRHKKLQQNIFLLPGDTVVIP